MCVRWQLGRMPGRKGSQESRLVRGSVNAGREPRYERGSPTPCSTSHCSYMERGCDAIGAVSQDI